MTRLRDNLTGAGPFESGPRIRLADADDMSRRRALAVLLTGRDRPNDMAVGHFVNYAAEHRLALDRLWIAEVGGRPIAAAVVVVAPGRSAMLFASPCNDPTATPVTARVVEAAVDSLADDEAAIVQALVDPDQPDTQVMLESAGFGHLADLQYMTRRSPRSRRPPAAGPDLPRGLRAVRYDESRRTAFGQAVLATYEGTLDCPGLIGLRRVDDILDGHMATGQFDPNLWLLVEDESGQPAATMLLNPLPLRRAMELVYLGLTPGFRGLGLGKTLLEYGLALARPNGATELVLAVDANNTPAVRLYTSLRFVTDTRKRAFVRAMV